MTCECASCSKSICAKCTHCKIIKDGATDIYKCISPECTQDQVSGKIEEVNCYHLNRTGDCKYFEPEIQMTCECKSCESDHKFLTQVDRDAIGQEMIKIVEKYLGLKKGIIQKCIISRDVEDSIVTIELKIVA